MSTSSIAPSQRFSRARPCPVCQGSPGLPAGKGQRCPGYLSADGRYAHCTREEYAGDLPPTGANPPTYAHRLDAPCRCGVDHRTGAPVSTAVPPSSGGATPRRRKVRETVYPSISASGITVAEHHRVDFDDGNKRMWWTRNGRKGLGGYPVADLPLYNLPRLLAADRATPVIVTEGEKAATALRDAGVLAVGTVTGAPGPPPSLETLRPLAGRPVYLWPDHDDVGRDHMKAIARLLITELDTLPWLIFWNEAPEGGDAYDWFARGRTVADLHALMDNESVMYAIAEPQPDVTAPSSDPSLATSAGASAPASTAARADPASTPSPRPQRLSVPRADDFQDAFSDLVPGDVDLDTVDDDLKQAAAQISWGIGQVDDKEAEGKIADQIVAIVRDPDLHCDLFHDQLERTYVRLPIAKPVKHREVWRIHSRQFENWLRWRYFKKTEKSVRGDAITTALATLDGLALFDGPERSVSLRIAGHQGAIYLDLGNAGWEIVKIDAYGWVVLRDEEVPDAVCFWRPRTMEALPMPVTGGDIEELRRFVNVVDGDWPLLIGFLLACFRPEGPFPLLELSGEQGSAKTTTAKVVRRLIDPSQALVRSSPREERDLAIGAQRAWLPVFDNLSSIPQWMSDGLCGLSTGRAFAIRANYSDDDEVVFDAMRPVIVAGIESVISSGDLLDRAVILVLPRLADHEEESAFWRAFEAARPSILGALLGVVSGALAQLPTVRIETLPRMADFAVWVTAAERRLGWEAGTFIGAYVRRRGETDLLALEASALGGHLRTWLVSQAGRQRITWEGTATELLDRLNTYVGESVARSRVWPKQPNKLSGALRRLAPNLRAVGIEVDLGERSPDKQRARLISITYDPTSVPPLPPEGAGTRSSASSASSGAAPPDSRMPGVERDERVSAGHVGADDRPDDHPVADDHRADDGLPRADDRGGGIVRHAGPGVAWVADDADDADDPFPPSSQNGRCPVTGGPHEYAKLRRADGARLCIECQQPETGVSP